MRKEEKGRDMEELTLSVIQKLRAAESIDQMLAIVTEKLQQLVKKFEDRHFTSLKPALEYQHDRDAKEEIKFIKEGLEGKWPTPVPNEKYTFIKQQVEEVLNLRNDKHQLTT